MRTVWQQNKQKGASAKVRKATADAITGVCVSRTRTKYMDVIVGDIKTRDQRKAVELSTQERRCATELQNTYWALDLL